MKRVLKSAFAMLMAVAMVVSMTTLSAFAAGDAKIVIKGNGQEDIGGADRFSAYQIFSGTVGTDDDRQLVGLEWADGIKHADESAGNIIYEMKNSALEVDSSTFGTEFSTAYSEWQSKDTSAISEAQFVAQWLEQVCEDNPSYANAFARIAAKCIDEAQAKKSKTNDTPAGWVIDSLDAGYYLVIDNYKAASGNEQADGSGSTYILDVIGTQEVDLKASVPTVDKKVENAKGYLTSENKDVNFTLTGTVANNINEYSTYSYKFTDTLSTGLTGNQASVKVSINGHDFTETDHYNVTLDANVLTVSFDDLKSAIEDVDPTALNTPESIQIVVTYTAQLNKGAILGATGNTNTVKLEYSSNPYTTDKGETVNVQVRTYTLGLKITKQDEETTALENVEFQLKNTDDSQYAKFEYVSDGDYYSFVGWEAANTDPGCTLKTSSSGIIDIRGLDVGKYTLTETKALENFDTMKDIDFEVTASDPAIDAANGDLKDVTLSLAAGETNRDDVEITESSFESQAEVTITNFKAPILPHTGGIGALIVLTISAVTVLAGLTVVYTSIRKKNPRA